MHTAWIPLAMVVLLATPLTPGAADTGPGQALVLRDVSHTLDESTLVISGWVENRGALAVDQLVIDAAGFSPSGDLTAFGSDGIPWEIVPGGAERFSIRLPIQDQLVRDYAVQVSSAHRPSRPLAGVRRGVDLALYRPLLFSMVRVAGDVRAGLLTIRSKVGKLPVVQVTVEVTLFLPDPVSNRLQTFTVTVPADGTVAILLGVREASLLTVRVADLLLKTSWTE